MTRSLLNALAERMAGLGVPVHVMPAYPLPDAALPAVCLEVREARTERISITHQTYRMHASVRLQAIAKADTANDAYALADDLLARALSLLLLPGRQDSVDITLSLVQYEQGVEARHYCAAIATLEVELGPAWTPAMEGLLEVIEARYNVGSGPESGWHYDARGG